VCLFSSWYIKLNTWNPFFSKEKKNQQIFFIWLIKLIKGERMAHPIKAWKAYRLKENFQGYLHLCNLKKPSGGLFPFQKSQLMEEEKLTMRHQNMKLGGTWFCWYIVSVLVSVVATNDQLRIKLYLYSINIINI